MLAAIAFGIAIWLVGRVPPALRSEKIRNEPSRTNAPAANVSATSTSTATSTTVRTTPRKFSAAIIGKPRDADHLIRLITHEIDTSEKSEAGAPAREWLGNRVAMASPLRRWIVQLSGPVREADKASLTKAGAVLCGYLPEHAFAAKMDGATLGRVAALPVVQWIGPYKPEYKIQPRLAAKTDAMVLVDLQTFTPGEVATVGNTVEKTGGKKIAEVIASRFGRVRAEIPLAMMSNFAAMDAVQWIEEFVPPRLFNNRAAERGQLNATNVWTGRGLTGTGQVVAVADTGLDTGDISNLHTDFMGRVKNAYALGRASSWSDPHGHGTHVCGSVLGDGTASGGKYRGIAHGAQLVMQSVLDSGGGLGGLPSDLNVLFLQAYTNGARVHSNSWGSPADGFYASESRDVDEFIWDHPDMNVCIAAGNDGYDGNNNGVIDLDSMGSPATAKNSLTVGAAENFHNAGEASSYQYINFGYFADPIRFDPVQRPSDGVHQGMAAFSSRGPCDDGRTKPDIVAPGTDVISTKSSLIGSGGWGDAPDFPAKYMIDGGTSMATPLAAGCAALFRQFFVQRTTTTNPSAALIKGAMMNGARSLFPGQYGTGAKQEIPGGARPNNVEGWGHIDVEGTLFPPAPMAMAFFDGDTLATGMTNVYSVNIGGAGAIRVTLCWSDFPATPGSSHQLINDLDLVVVGPGGVTNFAGLGPGPDRTNNIEGIDLDGQETGVYRIEVRGHDVPQGPQPYALVLRGAIAPVIVHTPLINTTDTVSPYAVDAEITSLIALDTNQLFVLWNTDGSENFTAATLGLVSNHHYRGFIPAQPLGTKIFYYLTAATNGLFANDPSDAPATLHSFSVTEPKTLAISGAPVQVGGVFPPYGIVTFASGNTVIATAPAFAWTPDLNGFVCTGWTGSGSVPMFGNSTSVTFQALEDSTLTWRWRFDSFGLHQVSIPSGIIDTTTWWSANSAGSTIAAPATAIVTGATNRLASWYLDGVRLPSATGATMNPAPGFLMSTSHTATALYIPDAQDNDANGLPDWWEMYYFGATGNLSSADSDGDGFSNADELADGTNPRDAFSTPRPPNIVHTPLANPQTRPAPWNVSATITDNFAVAFAMLNWQRNGGSWQSATMTNGGSNVWSAAIPTPGIGGDSFTYYIIAIDPAGHASSSGPRSFSVSYPVIAVAPPNLGTNIVERGTTDTVSLVVGNTGVGSLFWTSLVVRIDVNDDIEGGTNGLAHSGNLDRWHISTYRSYSSSHAWYMGDDSTHVYLDQTDARLQLPPLRPGNNAVFSFWQWMSSEYDGGLYFWDGGVIEISTDGGASFASIPPVGGYPYLITPNPDSPFPASTPCLAGLGTGWEKITVDLSAYAGINVLLRLRFGADHYTVAEGWYIDDMMLTCDATTNDWINLQTAGTVAPLSASNIPVRLNANIASNSGLYHATIRFDSNDPLAPTNIASVAMRVDARPAATITFAQQSPLDGSGSVTISNALFDLDGDAISLQAEVSTNSGATWTNIFVSASTAASGSPSISNLAVRQLSNILSPSNTLKIVWPSTNAPAIGFNPAVRVRVTPWDGLLSGMTVTSTPFAIDNIAPSATGAVVTLSTSPFGNYIVGNIGSVSWTGFTDTGIGIAGYFVGTTNASATTNGNFAAAPPSTISPLAINATNTVFVWARDAAGNIGPASAATIFALDPNGDADADGFSNADEETAGTSATNSASVLRIIDTTIDPVTLHHFIHWSYISNRVYSLQMMSNVFDPPFLVMTNPPVILTNNTAIFDITNAPPAEQIHFRLGVQPAP